jgi:hypothetical protein
MLGCTIADHHSLKGNQCVKFIMTNCFILQENEEIRYSKWIFVDRSSLWTVYETSGKFIESLTNAIYTLSPHHFTAKSQVVFPQYSYCKCASCMLEVEYLSSDTSGHLHVISIRRCVGDGGCVQYTNQCF